MKRGDTDSSRSVHIVGEQCVSTARKNFLTSGSNKDRLVKYYPGYCKKTLFRSEKMKCCTYKKKELLRFQWIMLLL